MELRIAPYKMPEAIEFNFEELKAELIDRAAMYETVVYDDAHIKEAKADRASLNKLKKAINDERIRRKKEYMKPFEEFEEKVAEIIQIIDRPCAIIDKQVKEYEDGLRQRKLESVVSLWEDGVEHPHWMTLRQFWSEKWLNASVTMKSIEAEMRAKVEQAEKDMAVLLELPEYSFEAQEEYKRTLNLQAAIEEGKRLADIQKRKAEQEAAKTPDITNAPAQTPVFLAEEEAEAQWVAFEALLTVEQAKALKGFFRANGITFRPVEVRK